MPSKCYTSEQLADMTSALRLLLGALLLSVTGVFARFAGGAMEGMETAENIQREQIDRLHDFLGPVPSDPAPGTVAKREAPISFSNPRAKEFFVDGTKIPDGALFKHNCAGRRPLLPLLIIVAVNFDAGPSWSGLMPISGAKNETRKLFFWYVPVFSLCL